MLSLDFVIALLEYSNVPIAKGKSWHLGVATVL